MDLTMWIHGTQLHVLGCCVWLLHRNTWLGMEAMSCVQLLSIHPNPCYDPAAIRMVEDDLIAWIIHYHAYRVICHPVHT